MAAVTPSIVAKTEFSGSQKLLVISGTLTTASDTITLTAANAAGVQSISAISSAVITSGMAAGFLALQPTFSGLVITVASKGQDGLAATTFGAITLTLIVNLDR